uniref:Protein PsbN n=1 Tax=Chloropicon mariensis TaxID=1606511 RepID=A0A4D6C2E5_9CHLO|nr:N protein of photosystem II [Chloropicon mariensis]QBX97850.1 N protein of photosystem II [Chloropicon mariensis]UQK95299.1 photosystem II protein N [Chloropicon mariensis]
MEFSALFSAVFISCFVFSLTVYSIYLGFGPGSEELRDPFEEHED